MRDIGTVAICSMAAPQSPGQRSMVSRTVKVMDGTIVKVPSGLRVTAALPAALRSSLNGEGCAPTGQLACELPIPPAILPGISPITLKFISSGPSGTLIWLIALPIRVRKSTVTVLSPTGNAGGLLSISVRNASTKKSVVPDVVAELLKSAPNWPVKFWGGEPPKRYWRHNGTTRVPTFTAIPPSRIGAERARSTIASCRLANGRQKSDGQ